MCRASMSTNYWEAIESTSVPPEDSHFEKLSETERKALLAWKWAFDTLLLRDKTIAMADVFYSYMKRDWWCDSYRHVDIGVWGGWLPIELFKNDKARGRTIIQEYHGIDIDDKALAVAANNAKKHWLQLNLHKGDLLHPLHEVLANNSAANIALTANLPYNTDAEWDTYDEVIRAEPRHAIVWWGEDWLDMYREFLEQFATIHDKVHILILQWSSSNTYKLCNMCDALHIPGMEFYVEHDGRGKPRYVLWLRMKQHLYESPNM